MDYDWATCASVEVGMQCILLQPNVLESEPQKLSESGLIPQTEVFCNVLNLDHLALG